MLLFGGTFDPPHEGHLTLAQRARDAWAPGGSAWVVFVPAARSPHKGTGPEASGPDRIAMLEAALAGAARAGVWGEEVRRGELSDPPEPSYWVDTLETARAAARPGVRLGFLIGSDQLVALPRWRAWRRILELAEPVVVLRDPHRTVLGLLDALRGEPAWGGECVEAWGDRVVRLPLMDVSATVIRGRLRAGEADAPGVPAGVMGVIRARGLYGVSG